MSFFIGFRQPVPFLYHTGNNRTEEIAMQAKRNRFFQSPQQVSCEDWFEVFISGKGYPHDLANISSKTIKQIIIDS